MPQFPKRPASAEFEALLNAQVGSYHKGFSPGERVQATVLEVRDPYVVLDVQAKREGLVRIEELKDESGAVTVQPGQTIEVIFAGVQDGAFIFTTRAGSRVAVDQSLAQAHASGLPVEGIVQSEVNGGYEVMIGGRRAFCPFSQIALFKQEGAQYVGLRLTFIVQEYDPEGRNVVVSRRALLEQEREVQRETLKSDLHVGQTRTGKVTRLVDFGFFVDLGGMEGLVPLKEVSWQRDVKPADLVKEGDTVQVMVREIDWERNRISLSFRGAQSDPFDSVAARYPVGSSVHGKVTHIEAFGAFVELAPGVEGLVPIGKLGAGRRLVNPREVVSEGQEIDVQVESIDAERRRIGLRPIDSRVSSLKPGELAVGATVDGIVESIKEFGVFVRLSEKQTGLLHISETDVPKGGNGAARLERAFPPGATIKVVIKAMDAQRISLAIPERWQKETEEGESVSNYFRNRRGSGDLGSLGDLLSGLKL